MSKIGKKPIEIPSGVQVELGQKIVVKGPLGELSTPLLKGIKIDKEENILTVSRENEEKETKAFHGLIRSLVANMVEGVSKGFKKQLELQGIGYRVALQGNKLVLSVGYSHQVEIEAPDDIKFNVADNKIDIFGISKEHVGQIAAKIRQVRKPNVYKGKGIRYAGEVVKLKPGKTAKAAG